jgi:excinuclease ABC subunit A
LGVLACVTGVSGSGKSTLINQTLVPALKRHLELVSLPPAAHQSIDGMDQVDSLVFVDQKPVGRSAKSCPATYTGLFDEFRKMFAATRVARERGYTITRFSFNSKTGRCEQCLGHGHQKVRLDFLPDVFVKCDACQGRRFNPLTLQAKFGEFSIADVLEMTVEQALLQFSGFSRIARVLQCLSDVGLGYVKLGQPANSLSGGESQRIKLAKELSVPREGHTMYVLDEPTTGLHFADIDELLTVLHRIVDQGNSMIVIEHNLDVVANADWVIDLGPEGGEGGGNLVAAGTPEDVAKVAGSLTGQFLH